MSGLCSDNMEPGQLHIDERLRTSTRLQHEQNTEGMPVREELSYREFIGDLGVVAGGRDTELHVKYGVDNEGRYVDWSISVVICGDGVQAIRASGGNRTRAVVRRFRTVRGRVIKQEFSPQGGAPDVTDMAFHSGDADQVDRLYDEVLALVSRNYHVEVNSQPEPHQVATFGYASVERSQAFHEQHPDQSRTVIAVDSDTADELIDRQGHYFKETGGRIAAYFPETRRFVFPRFSPSEPRTSNAADGASTRSETVRVSPTLTVGMLVDTVSHDDEWTIPEDWTQ